MGKPLHNNARSASECGPHGNTHPGSHTSTTLATPLLYSTSTTLAPWNTAPRHADGARHRQQPPAGPPTWCCASKGIHAARSRCQKLQTGSSLLGVRAAASTRPCSQVACPSPPAVWCAVSAEALTTRSSHVTRSAPAAMRSRAAESRQARGWMGVGGRPEPWSQLARHYRCACTARLKQASPPEEKRFL